MAKMVVCDDDPKVLELVSYLGREEGYDVITAADGERALHLAKAEMPDLVVLDIMMPKKDGFEVCAELKSDAATRGAYIILLTASPNERDREKGLRSGAEEYTTKPFSPRELRERMQEVSMKHAPRRKVESLHSTENLIEELLAVYEELALLYSLGAKIGRLTNEGQIAFVALREAMKILQASCGWVLLWEKEALVTPVGCRINIAEGTVEHLNRTVLEPLCRQGQATSFVSHTLKEEFKLDEPDVPARLLASCLPIGWTRGYLCLGRDESSPMFTSANKKLINAVAFTTAVELDNLRLQRSELEKQRLENELELARNIQRSLLPRDFSCNDFLDAMGVSEPCFEIGGDYFDLIRTGTDTCLLVIADVAGKGPSAALQAAMVQGVVHGVSRHSQDLSCLMGTLNQCILTRAAGRYVTAFLAVLDRAGGLRYANAGHNPPLWIRKDGSVTELTEAGLLLGFQETAIYLGGFIQLVPGDLLLLYTDGVTDSVNERDETFGLVRLLSWAGQQAGKFPAEVKESLIYTVRQFCGKSRQADDLTVLVIQYREPSGLAAIAT